MNTRSALFEHCAMMVRLQSDMAQQFGSLPAPISPLPKPDTDSQKGGGDLPFVATQTGD